MKKIAWTIWMVLVTSAVYAESRTATIQAVVTVPPLLELSVAQQESHGASPATRIARSGSALSLVKGIEFTGSEPVEVELEVLSNLGIPYQLIQSIDTPLMDRNGHTLPQENVIVQIEGREIHLQSVPQVLTVSDAKGESRKVSVKYVLRSSSGQNHGVYRADFVYSVSTL